MIDHLHLGCGRRHRNGWVNADVNPDVGADMVFDMDGAPWPFPDNTFCEVFTSHVLEHSRNYLAMLGELWRVCQPDATLDISVPYVTRSLDHLCNPYHHVNFNEHSFDWFDPDKLLGSANERTPIRLRTEKVEYVYFKEWQGLPKRVLQLARRHLFNVVECIAFRVRVLK